MFTDLIEGETRRVDIVIEVKLKGTDSLIIIHVEPQSYRQPEFNERMYQYFSLLYNKYRKPILPIAIFSYDENQAELNEFTIDFPFFHVLTFQFLMLELRKIDWRQYVHSNYPVAAALISKMELINGFFETYLTLNESEEKELMKEIKQLNRNESEQIFKLPNSW